MMNTKTILAVSVVLGLLSFALDGKIAIASSVIQFQFLSYVMEWFSNISSLVIVLLVMASLFMWQERKKKWIKVLWLSFLTSSVLAFVIKLVVARTRPEHAAFMLTQFSFPSMHTAIAFSLLPVLDREFPVLKRFWLLFAVLIAFSRLYLGVHYLSDVVWGAILGYSIGNGFVWLQDKKKLDWLTWKKVFH